MFYLHFVSTSLFYDPYAFNRLFADKSLVLMSSRTFNQYPLSYAIIIYCYDFIRSNSESATNALCQNHFICRVINDCLKISPRPKHRSTNLTTPIPLLMPHHLLQLSFDQMFFLVQITKRPLGSGSREDHFSHVDKPPPRSTDWSPLPRSPAVRAVWPQLVYSRRAC